MRQRTPTMVLALGIVLFHVLTAPGYGYFRDELYYLACAEHLGWGYVDHPPLIALMAWLVRHSLGTSLHALRLLPALAAGATALLTAEITRELGGGRAAAMLAALAVALAPIDLALLSIFSMNALDLVVWAALLLVLTRLLRTGDGRLWLAFGVIAGIGLENKLSVLFLCFGVAVGLLAARQWRQLRDHRLWLGAALAAALFAPHVIWQAAHGWPTAEFVRNATLTKNLSFSPLAFLRQQVQIMNPLTLPLWLGGLGYLLFARVTRPFRLLAWLYPAVLAVMLSQNAKPYYLAPIYPLLFAAGALALERLAERRSWILPASASAVVVSGLLLAPLAKPLLPLESYVRYAAALGQKPGSDERHALGRLPQFFADMHGWRELEGAVARVHRALPAEDRARACIFARNYGDAGAIDLFGPPDGLPHAISGHNSYWLWGPRGCDGSVVIVIGGQREALERSFAQVEAAGRFSCADCMPFEGDQVLWVGRRRLSQGEAWPRLKHYE